MEDFRRPWRLAENRLRRRLVAAITHGFAWDPSYLHLHRIYWQRHKGEQRIVQYGVGFIGVQGGLGYGDEASLPSSKPQNTKYLNPKKTLQAQSLNHTFLSSISLDAYSLKPQESTNKANKAATRCGERA